MTTVDVTFPGFHPARLGAEGDLLRLIRRFGAAEPSGPTHARLVDALSGEIAEALGLPALSRRTLRVGALLHDVGKAKVPPRILAKPGPLTAGEWRVIRRHPADGVRLLSPIVPDPAGLAIVYAHHERWDGGGYPSRLAGDAIPLGARIVAVADAFYAMTEARPYRRPLAGAEALGELRANAGLQFDPACVDAACFVLLPGHA